MNFMHKVTVKQNSKSTVLTAKSGEGLSSLLVDAGFFVDRVCGGKGTCKKCIVDVDGNSVLSCQYTINKDIVVTLTDTTHFVHEQIDGKLADNMCFVLDIGTTTVELALIDKTDGRIIDSIKKTNPQRVFGADVISRIDYCAKNGVSKLNAVIVKEINNMLATIINKYKIDCIDKLYVSGNTTMLHLFFGTDCSSMGISPYTPIFTDSKIMSASEAGVNGVQTVISLPSISAFVGADIVAGLNFAQTDDNGKYNLLIDMGTNAEIVLYNNKSVLCTAAAAGPCFEGANISCGSNAVDGAIYQYKNNKSFATVNNATPVGICATGLIDIMAQLVKYQTIDKTGLLEYSPFSITENVYINQEDVRNFQLAKSAVHSAIICLMNEGDITFEQIEKVYISGGFAEKINIENATQIGLLPKELKDKCVAVNNSALAGTIKFATGKNNTDYFVNHGQYIDLSTNEKFVDLFIDNMMF